jgi:hypothetical protein
MSVAIIIVLIILIAIIVTMPIVFVYLQPKAINFWATPDSPGITTQLNCPANSKIVVQNADYGAPWSGCPWTDVTSETKNIIDGSPSYEFPSNFTTPNLLNIPEPCQGINKIYAGSYYCI